MIAVINISMENMLRISEMVFSHHWEKFMKYIRMLCVYIYI